MRYSLRILLLAVTLSALALFGGLKLRQEWLIPRTPLTWRDCTPAQLEKLPDNQNHIVIVAADWDFSSCFSTWRRRLETPELRKLAARESIQTHYCDITADPNIIAFFEVASRVDIDHEHKAPHVLIKRGKQWVACPIHRDSITLDDTQKLIETAFGSNSSTPMDLEVLVQSLRDQQRDRRPKQPTLKQLLEADHFEPKFHAELSFLPGSGEGIVEVKVDLAEGWFIFAMNEPNGGLGLPCVLRLDGPTKNAPLPEGLQQIGIWAPISPADPVTIEGEKHFVHESVIVWRAKVAIGGAVDPSHWKLNVVLKGQICSDTSCMPIVQEIPVTIVNPTPQKPEPPTSQLPQE